MTDDKSGSSYSKLEAQELLRSHGRKLFWAKW
jgi:hypothetical protein